MLVNKIAFTFLLQTIRLTQGSFEPIPSSPAVTMIANGSDSSGLLFIPPDRPIGVKSQAARQVPLDASQADCSVDPYTSPFPLDEASPPFDQAMANIYRYRQQQSVNLGSWFVHEQWMTPSIFKCASGKRLSELDIASGWGSISAARAVLEQHWDTFITQADFEYLASIGINTVRLPIGYWSLGPDFCQDTPFSGVADVYQNSWGRVIRAINMAAESGLGVLVDLHGAVGSQNGQPHSGISDGVAGLFNDSANMDKTIDVLVFLGRQLSCITNVVGLQILNEPIYSEGTESFYGRAISSVRAASPADVSLPLYVHDGFDLGRSSQWIANRTDFVVQDHHSYFVFTPSDAAEPASQHTSDIQTNVADSLAGASVQEHRNLIIGEWSCALTSQSISNESDKGKARRDFCTGQMGVYTNVTAGWSFWSYMKEDCDDDPGWCFKAAVNRSLPATFFSYGQGPYTTPSQLQTLVTVVANMSPPSDADILANYRNQNLSPRSRPSKGQRVPSSHLGRMAPRFPHRFKAIQQRNEKREMYDGADMTPEQISITKGYADGFQTGKTFAAYSVSKLGFIGQYVSDSLVVLGPVIAEGTEHYYSDWFVKGLRDAETICVSTITAQGL